MLCIVFLGMAQRDQDRRAQEDAQQTAARVQANTLRKQRRRQRIIKLMYYKNFFCMFTFSNCHSSDRYY